MKLLQKIKKYTENSLKNSKLTKLSNVTCLISAKSSYKKLLHSLLNFIYHISSYLLYGDNLITFEDKQYTVKKTPKHRNAQNKKNYKVVEIINHYKKINMKVHLRKIYNQSGQETGAVLSASFPVATTLHEKYNIEKLLIDYAFTILYPSEGLNIYRDMYVDTPSITVIKNINDLIQQELIINIP